MIIIRTSNNGNEYKAEAIRGGLLLAEEDGASPDEAVGSVIRAVFLAEDRQLTILMEYNHG